MSRNWRLVTRARTRNNRRKSGKESVAHVFTHPSAVMSVSHFGVAKRIQGDKPLEWLPLSVPLSIGETRQCELV